MDAACFFLIIKLQTTPTVPVGQCCIGGPWAFCHVHHEISRPCIGPKNEAVHLVFVCVKAHQGFSGDVVTGGVLGVLSSLLASALNA